MLKITLKIDGMMCGMCEAHINDAIRRDFPIKKVTSSHIKGITEIVTEVPLDEEKLKSVIEGTGYTLTEIKIGNYEKKSFSFFGKKHD